MKKSSAISYTDIKTIKKCRIFSINTAFIWHQSLEILLLLSVLQSADPIVLIILLQWYIVFLLFEHSADFAQINAAFSLHHQLEDKCAHRQGLFPLIFLSAVFFHVGRETAVFIQLEWRYFYMYRRHATEKDLWHKRRPGISYRGVRLLMCYFRRKGVSLQTNHSM